MSVWLELAALSEQRLVLVAGKRTFHELHELVALEAKLPSHRRRLLGSTEAKPLPQRSNRASSSSMTVSALEKSKRRPFHATWSLLIVVAIKPTAVPCVWPAPACRVAGCMAFIDRR